MDITDTMPFWATVERWNSGGALVRSAATVERQSLGAELDLELSPRLSHDEAVAYARERWAQILYFDEAEL